MFLEISLLIILVIILLCLVFYPVKIAPPQIVKHNQLSSVCFGNPPAGGCFQVELARTESERDQGLMYRKELDKNKGMLFIFDKEGIYPFWMKNTLIPLDMIWIDSNNKIVFIAQNVQPCKTLKLAFTAPFPSHIVPSPSKDPIIKDFCSGEILISRLIGIHFLYQCLFSQLPTVLTI